MDKKPLGGRDKVRTNGPRQALLKPDGRVVGMASADYFGECARIMPYRLGGNPSTNLVAFVNNGASGDINNIDFYGTRPPRAPFEQIRMVATKTADAAWRAVKKIEHYDENPLIRHLLEMLAELKAME